MPLAAGQVLNNRYRIVKLLGKGGFGAVYRAWDINLNRPCAFKENLATDPEAARQFEREARLLANLNHPNLARVTDYFIIPGQGQYLVMDFVDGQDMQSMLDSIQPATAPSGMLPLMQGSPIDAIGLPESQVLPWISQVCDALIYLHTQHPPVIHRDIKPANIRITSQGKAVLVDFGIAKLYDPQHQTTAGARAYTPGYSPPEQYGSGKTDARSDIYALGATAYTLLTGHRPPESIEIVTNRANPPPPAHLVNPGISPTTGLSIEQAMQINAALRPGSAAEFKALLSGWHPQTVSAPVQVPQAAPMQAAPPLHPALPTSTSAARTNRNWLLWVGLGALALVVFGISIIIGSSTGGGESDLPGTETALALVPATLTGQVPTQTGPQEFTPTSPLSLPTLTGLASEPTATLALPGLTEPPPPIVTITPSPPPTTGQLPLPGDGLVRLTFGDGNYYRSALSPDQRSLASYTQIDGFWQIVEIDPASGGVVRQVTAEGFDHYLPVFHPDGRHVIIASNSSGSFNIYLLDFFSGQIVQQLTDSNAFNSFPYWMSDGNSFVFVSDRDGNKEIYQGFLDGSPELKLTDNSADEYTPVVSPDGRYMAYYSTRDGNPEIYLMELSSRQERRLTDSNARDAEPWFSPDGGWIVFESNRSGNYDIWAMRLDGSDLHQVTDSPDREQMPSVSPDGLWVIFSSKQAGGYDVFRIPWR
jgi:serine/threonine protein kinase